MNAVAAGLPRVIYLKARGKLFKRTRDNPLKGRDVKSLLRFGGNSTRDKPLKGRDVKSLLRFGGNSTRDNPLKGRDIKSLLRFGVNSMRDKPLKGREIKSLLRFGVNSTRDNPLKGRDIKSLLRMEVARLIFCCLLFVVCCLMVGALSGCAMSGSSAEGDENKYIYPYKCTYKGEVEYHSITAREPLSDAFLAKMHCTRALS